MYLPFHCSPFSSRLGSPVFFIIRYFGKENKREREYRREIYGIYKRKQGERIYKGDRKCHCMITTVRNAEMN